jgi:hypothetical protein
MTMINSVCTCQKCNKTYDDKIRPCPYCGYNLRDLSVFVVDEISLKESFGLKTFRGKIKKFLSHTKIGWFPSNDKEKYPNGVNLIQTVDRENNLYIKKVYEDKTNRELKNLEEPLDKHIKK